MPRSSRPDLLDLAPVPRFLPEVLRRLRLRYVPELPRPRQLADPLDGARELLRRGAELVLLSQGADGMLAISASATGPDLHVLHARLDRVLAGNPTGAGDAAVAAGAVLMDAGIHDPEQILRRATAWSAAAVLMPLAGEIHPSWPNLERDLIVGPAAVAPAAPAPANPAEFRR